jgi:hypothetical protein
MLVLHITLCDFSLNVPPENAEEQNATTKTEFATASAIIHFFVLGHSMGFLGSLVIHSTA